MKFNINNEVRVKLTDEGIRIYEKRYRDITKRLPNEAKKHMERFRRPESDEEGYSRMQLWELMNLYGEYMYNGNMDIPFETEIDIPDEYLISHTEQSGKKMVKKIK